MKEKSFKGTAKDVHKQFDQAMKKGDVEQVACLYCHYYLDGQYHHPENRLTRDEVQGIVDLMSPMPEILFEVYFNRVTTFQVLQCCAYLVGVVVTQYKSALQKLAIRACTLTFDGDSEGADAITKDCVDDVANMQSLMMSVLAGIWEMDKKARFMNDFLPDLIREEMRMYKKRKDIIAPEVRATIKNEKAVAMFDKLMARVPALAKVKIDERYFDMVNSDAKIYLLGLQKLQEKK